MISDATCEADLDSLVDTDDKAAELKVNVERQQYILKRIEAAHYVTTEGSVAERQAQAKLKGEVQKQEETYLQSYLESEKINNMRKTLDLRIRVYQTQSSNRRSGM